MYKVNLENIANPSRLVSVYISENLEQIISEDVEKMNLKPNGPPIIVFGKYTKYSKKYIKIKKRNIPKDSKAYSLGNIYSAFTDPIIPIQFYK